MDLYGIKRKGKEWKEYQKTRIIPSKILEEFADSKAKGSYKVRELYGKMTTADGLSSQFDYRKWKWLALSPYMISNKCCDVMKKSPSHSYQTKTGRKGMTAQMAAESRLRTQQWLHNGCNGFNMKRPISNPMSFWVEQDVLQYIYRNDLPICEVYGEIVPDYEATGQIEGQMSMFPDSMPLKTTGAKRTGCMFCGYGCHLEKPGEGRFERMKITHPSVYEWIMKPWDQGGLGYKDVIDWLNEHGGLDIRY